MNEVLFNLLISVVMLLIMLIGKYMIPLIKAKLENTKLASVTNCIDEAVKAAEQSMSSVSGAERKAWVTNFIKTLLLAKKISISDEQISALIESAVYAINSLKFKEDSK